MIAAAALTLTAPSQDGTLNWHAPASCPDRDQMHARLAAAGGTGQLNVSGTITEVAPQQWRLDLRIGLDGNDDLRVLEGTDCASLADAAELLIGVRRDEVAEQSAAPVPTAKLEPAPQIPEPEPASPDLDTTTPPTSSQIRPERAPPPVAAPRRPRAELPTGLTLGVAAGLSLGATPAPGVPAELAIGWSGARARIAARARYHFPRRVGLGNERVAVVQLGTAGIEGCARLAIPKVEFPICAQASVGASRSDGSGPQTRDRNGIWAEAGIDGGVAWYVAPRWALTARLGIAGVLAGTRYVLSDALVFEPSPVVGRVVFGVQTHWPIQFRRRPEKR